MAWSTTHEEMYKKLKSEVYEAGGTERIEKQHKRGKLTARARMEALFDNGQFDEIDMLLKSRN